MDPRTFDGMIRQLSRALSRRSLVGGSLGAAVLAAAGLSDDAQAKKKGKAEACLPPGQRCGTKKKDEPCRKCCQGYHVVTPSGKKKCACRPDGVDCTNPSQCCTGTCPNGRCGAAPCLPAGAGCTSPSQCCVGICQNGRCGAPTCNSVNAICGINSDCCSGICGCIEDFLPISICTCRNATCGGPEAECLSNADCCEEFCDNFGGGPGVCVPP